MRSSCSAGAESIAASCNLQDSDLFFTRKVHLANPRHIFAGFGWPATTYLAHQVSHGYVTSEPTVLWANGPA